MLAREKGSPYDDSYVSSESKFDNSSNDDDMRDMNNLAVVLGFILDGDLEIGAHVWSDIGYLICSRHLFRSRAVINHIFSFICVQQVLSYHLI